MTSNIVPQIKGPSAVLCSTTLAPLQHIPRSFVKRKCLPRVGEQPLGEDKEKDGAEKVHEMETESGQAEERNRKKRSSQDLDDEDVDNEDEKEHTNAETTTAKNNASNPEQATPKPPPTKRSKKRQNAGELDLLATAATDILETQSASSLSPTSPTSTQTTPTLQEDPSQPHPNPETNLYHCPFPSCPKTFTTKERLRCHRKCHLLTRSHVCTVCNEGFFRRQDLSRHMATHSTVKGYACPLCGTRFTRMDARQRHVRTRRCHGAEGISDEAFEIALRGGSGASNAASVVVAADVGGEKNVGEIVTSNLGSTSSVVLPSTAFVPHQNHLPQQQQQAPTAMESIAKAAETTPLPTPSPSIRSSPRADTPPQ
ncbi:hypothetical protein HDU97_005724 [Phlyctochytrium planicorne]|nr:hypothetical protein HDU97_005724 [Phlyctochytrium planicorne]